MHTYTYNTQCDGYNIGLPGMRTLKVAHLLFVADLKTYASSQTIAHKQLDLISQFTNDIGMRFGVDKCAYLYMEKGKNKTIGPELEMNGLQITELDDDKTYKYLGMDENIAYQGSLNKERVIKEYTNRVRKIWKFDLNARNKVVAHNSFAVPILTPTFGILNWSKEDVLAIDIKTRKILTYTGNFHRNSNVDRLYTTRDKGGRGLSSIYDAYVIRLISLSDHLKIMSEKHNILKTVLEHEKEGLVSGADKLRISLGLRENPSSEETKWKIKKDHQNGYTSKPQHGLISRKQQRIDGFNEQYTNSWLNKLEIQSHAEGYICAIPEQEIYTKALKAKREHPNDASFDKRCRHCNKSTEDIFHLLGSCEALSASLYLPVRHSEVAKVIYNSLIKIYHPDEKYTRPCNIWRGENAELWWDYSITTTPQVKHNKPDIVLWVPSSMKCFIIDVCVPLDENIHAQDTRVSNR